MSTAPFAGEGAVFRPASFGENREGLLVKALGFRVATEPMLD